MRNAKLGGRKIFFDFVALILKKSCLGQQDAVPRLILFGVLVGKGLYRCGCGYRRSWNGLSNW